MVLRVAITSNTLDIGGAERQRVLLANGLAARGHRVQMVVLQHWGTLAEQLAPEVERCLSPVVPLRADRVDALITGVTNTEVAHAVWRRFGPGRTAGRWIAASHSFPRSGPTYSWKLRQGLRVADALVTLTEE